MKSRSFLILLALPLVMIGCEQDPYTIINSNLKRDGLVIDGSVGDFDGLIARDGPAHDGPKDSGPGSDADACVQSNNGIEICDGQDNDCNGQVDDVDPEKVKDDPDNCGKCGKVCVFLNAFAKCEQGTCAFDRCADGFYDINKDPKKDGCEYQCTVTNQGIEICDDADNDCNGTVDDGFDKQTNKDHCGKCNNRCLYNKAPGVCAAGKCQMGTCDSGFADINKSDTDGCEYQCPVFPTKAEECSGKDDDCDGAIDEGLPGTGETCDTSGKGECKTGTTKCSGGSIQCVANNQPSQEICDSKDNDCDGVVDNGFDTQTSVLHCGRCNNPCSFPNAIPKCDAGVCKIDRCLDGYKDLDPGQPGCEHKCQSWPPSVEKCNQVDDNCDAQVDEGFNLQTDPNNCGRCGNICKFPNATASCVAGKCQQGPCLTDFYDSDPGTPGCEYFCIKSNNGVEKCDQADNDCNGVVDDGFALQTDVQNCGTCGNVCQFSNAAASCVRGKCQMGACNTGFKDLNPLIGGCEYKCPVWPAAADETSVATRCDGVDNDCDGLVDEDYPSGLTCGTNQGECVAGTRTCVNGIESCQGETRPAPEVCDGRDNDCNGTIDDGFDKQNDPRFCGNCQPCVLPHAIPQCVSGACRIAVCEAGYVDLDPNQPGCEYQCTPTGPEICDGIDNDCDGQVDEGVSLSGNPCSTIGECNGATATCQGRYGWVCQYGANVETRRCTSDADCLNVPCNTTAGVCPGELPDDETRCDSRDNDCDGLSDEPFNNLGTACAETGQQGICQGKGTFVCSTDQTTTVCNITTPGQTRRNETCNGLDDDCDGLVDEHADDAGGLGVKDSTVRITRSGLDFHIYVYEASRPGATATSQGSLTTRACSQSGVLPWTSITQTDAAAACAAINPSCGGPGQEPCWRLCTAQEWQEACAGSSGRTYPYGATYAASTCNGLENDGDAGTAGDQDVLLPTGAKTSCVGTDGTFDMSGNAREWTNDPRSDGTPPDPDGYTVRGGAYDTTSGGLQCGSTFAIFPQTFAYPNLGFRCCRNH
jgi:hypothetical protein